MFLRRTTRYDLMNTQRIDGDPNEWFDCLSIDLDDFQLESTPKEVLLTELDTIRPDIFFYNNMGSNNLEDIVLWLNDIPSRRVMEAGTLMTIPKSSDLNSYYLRNRR